MKDELNQQEPCPDYARCEICGAISIEQTVEVQAGLLSHEGTGGEIHPVEADPS